MRGVGRAEEVGGFGREVVDDFRLELESLPFMVGLIEVEAGSASCFAREAAVGAVSLDEISAGLVASRGLVLGGEALVLVELCLSVFAALATEAAVGAVSELRLAFLAGSRELVAFDVALGEEVDGALAEDGVRGWLFVSEGDFSELEDAFEGALVDMAAGLPFGVGFFESAFGRDAERAPLRVDSCLLRLPFCGVSPFVFGVFGAPFCCLKSSVTGGRA